MPDIYLYPSTHAQGAEQRYIHRLKMHEQAGGGTRSARSPATPVMSFHVPDPSGAKGTLAPLKKKEKFNQPFRKSLKTIHTH